MDGAPSLSAGTPVSEARVACHDVVIVGAGQAGLASAWALRREGITNVAVLDARPRGQEGPWNTYARMPSLRTPKGPTGADCGVPDLTVRAWHDAVLDRATWERMTLMPTAHWMAYLDWVREQTGIEVANETRLLDVANGDGGCIRLVCRRAGAAAAYTLLTRKLVLATGLEGAGGAAMPDFVAGLGRAGIAHSSDMIDFTALRGRTVGVIGAGASAFDNAATAAEAGAAVVHHFVRRSELPTVNVVRWMDFAAFGRNFHHLPDARRRAYVRQFLGTAMPPPPETLARTQRLANHRLHLGASIDGLHRKAEGLLLQTAVGAFDLDFLILGTGFAFDLAPVSELAGVLPLISRWGDRPTAPRDGDALDGRIDRYPYLGPDFQLQAVDRSTSAWVENIHLVNSMAVASMGPISSGGINGLKFMVSRLARGILRDLEILPARDEAAWAAVS